MNLFINSPAYYTQKYGVIDDIYKLCLMISKNVDITLYTNLIDTVGITPIIAPVPVLKEGKWKEERKVSTPFRMASISLASDYNIYIEGDITIKKQIIVDNILESLKVINKKLKNDFDYDGIKKDIIRLVDNCF